MKKIKDIAIGLFGIGIGLIFYYILYRIFGKELIDTILYILKKISPIIALTNAIIFSISVIALPIIVIKRFRYFLARFYEIAAYIFIITIIVRCFHFSYINYGFISFIGFIGYGIGFIPIALVTYIIHGMWINSLEVVALIGVTLLFRYLSNFLKRKNDILIIHILDELKEKSENFTNDYKELKRFLEIAKKNIECDTARNELLISTTSARRKLKKEFQRIERSKLKVDDGKIEFVEIETIFTTYHITVLNILFSDFRESYNEYKKEYLSFEETSLLKFSEEKQHEIKLNNQIYNAMYKAEIIKIVEIARITKIDIALYKLYTSKFAFEDFIAKTRLETPDSYSNDEIKDDENTHDIFRQYQNHTLLFEEQLEILNNHISNDCEITDICREFDVFNKFLKDIESEKTRNNEK
jgi:hypothetical protein